MGEEEGGIHTDMGEEDVEINKDGGGGGGGEDGGSTEEDGGSIEDEDGSTDDLLNKLSAIEKAADKECRKTLGVTARSTRSKGTALKWSKSVNADKPIV